MSRYVGISLAVIVVSAMAGCRGSESERPQPGAAAEPPTAAPVADELPSETPGPATGNNTPNGAPAASAPNGAGAASAKPHEDEGAPSVLGAIGKAVSGAMGVSEGAQPSEAPAYRPPQ